MKRLAVVTPTFPASEKSTAALPDIVVPTPTIPNAAIHFVASTSMPSDISVVLIPI